MSVIWQADSREKREIPEVTMLRDAQYGKSVALLTTTIFVCS